MVSAWDVYWVMQLDAIRVMLALGGAASIAYGIFCLVQWIEHRDYEAREPYYGYGADAAILPKEIERRKLNEESRRAGAPAWLRRAKGVIGLGVALVAAFFLTPSTRTAATMLIVPKLTSAEVMQPVGAEARELLTLAKGALRRLAEVGDEPKPQK